tara:strand:- start:8 stop:283 length:276 start_codon:yes stop_codon:yes gene_type:complete
MNNQQVNSWASQFAQRIIEEVGVDRKQQVQAAYLRALSRQPDAQELALTMEAMDKITEIIQEGKSPEEVNLHVLSNVCHALINSAAFIYID